MAKKILRIILLYSVLLLVGISIGVFAAWVGLSMSGLPFFLIIMSFIYLFMTVHIFSHEAGHLVMGLVTGYRFVSFRVFHWIFVKGKDGHIHLKKQTVSGTGGQCLMAPPDVPYEQCPYMLYHLGGGLMNLVLGVIGILVALFVNRAAPMTAFLFYMFGVIGVGMCLMNLLPLPGMLNDGKNIQDIRKDPNAHLCIHLVLEGNAYITTAETFDDIPSDFIERLKALDFTTMDLSNASIANAHSFLMGIYQFEDNQEKVVQMTDTFLNTPNVPEIFVNEAKCEKLYQELIGSCRKELINEMYDKSLQKYIKTTQIYPSRLRLLVAYELYYNNDIVEARKQLSKLEQSKETYFSKMDASLEYDIAYRLVQSYEQVHCTHIDIQE